MISSDQQSQIFWGKKLAAQTWAKWAKIKPKTKFFVIFSSLVHLFSLKLHTMIACNNVQHLAEVKPMKKVLEHKFGPKEPKLGPKLVLVFLEIAYNDSLQQCITSSRGKSLEKKFWGENLG